MTTEAQPLSPTASVAQPCMLGYPDRFEAAANYIKRHAAGGKDMAQETQLLLYALSHQASKGPCNLGKPGGNWGWGNAEEVAKWQSWKSLGDMNRFEAMRLYVRTVEEEQPDWYAILTKDGADALVLETAPSSDSIAAAEPAPEPEATAEPQAPLRPASAHALPSAWCQVPQGTQRKPLPRYEHASAMLAGALCVVGGNSGGRYLSDVWKLDTQTMAWAQLHTKPYTGSPDGDRQQEQQGQQQGQEQQGQEQQGQQQQGHQGLPPIAGHSVTPWNDTLVILGGHSKPKDAPRAMPVRVLDPLGNVATLSPRGPAAPCSRGGHSASVIGRQLFVFGGEDPHRRCLGDLWSLDLDSMTWTQAEAEGKAPCPRSSHAAGVVQERYLVIFGGGSVATCYSDLFVLDTQSTPLRWSQPQVQGVKASPRAGHSGLVLGSAWYIVGGGNNVKGCTDMLALDVSSLDSGVVTWHVVTSIPARDPLSSEGISLVLLPPAVAVPAPLAAADAAAAGAGGEKSPEHIILGFGGYNGKYLNTVSVMGVTGTLGGPADAGSNGSAAAGKDVGGGGHAEASEAAPSPGAAASTAAAAAAAAASGQPGANQQQGREQQQQQQQGVAAPPAPKPPSDAQLISELRMQLEGARHDAEAALKEAASAKDSAGHELALLRKQVNTAHTSQAEATKGWEEAKAALAREREKGMKLEVEIAELNKKLGAAAELQKEVEALRRMVKEAEAKKGSGGVWGYLSGQ